MKEVKIGRRAMVRTLGFLGAASAVEGGIWLHEQIEHEETGETNCKVLDGFRSCSSAEQAARQFDDASTAGLLAVYPDFFPRLMNSCPAREVPDALEKEASRILKPRNPHRLLALPAIAAAHAISTTPARGARECLWERITDTLEHRNREVREIVLQNLVTATLPSPEGSDRWDASGGLIEAVLRVLKEAQDVPALLGPASIGLVFLLNTRSILSHRGSAAAARAAQVDRHIREALLPRPVHFSYLRQLQQAYESDFQGYDPHDVTSLPSHLTEMILQARHARRSTPKFNRVMALIHARITYEVWRTMSGLAKENATMTRTQAAHAFDKLIEFEAVSCLDKTLGAWPGHPAAKADRKFHSFCTDVLLPQLNEFESTGEACAHLAELRDLPHALPEYTFQSTAERIGPFVLGGIGMVLGRLLVHFLFERGLKCAESPPDPNIPDEQSAQIREAVEEARDLDQACGEELDARDREIGPARLRSED